jgi:cytoskeleton-associated protein 5
MGDGKEVMRTKIHSIFRQVCRIYPASKIFAYFMDGLKNKNSRTRSECLDELAKLLSRNGLSVLQPSRHLSAIGSLISDRDSQVRNAALNVLVQANQLMGPAALQKYLQGLSSKDLDMLDERLKRAAAGIKDIVVEKEENADMIDAPLPQVIENPVDVSSTALGINLSSMDYSNTGLPSPAPPTFRRNFEPSMLSNPLDHAIDQIQFSTDLVCIHALQTLETYLNNNEVDDDMRARINTLTHALIVRMKEATSTSYDVQEVAQMKSRLCRYVTNALVLITTNSSLCYELNEDVIELLVSETLSALVSERIRVFEDQEQLEKALNILIVKILEGVPQNRSYSALLTVLREAFRVPPAELDKFPELVMKCLWKLTKQLSMNLQIAGRINVPELLAEVHSFLTSLPPIEWKMRSNEGLAFQDLPLRTVKTILHEIVQHCGIKVLNELALIPDPEDSFVLSYLKAMLQARGISEQEINVHLNANDDLNMDVDQTGSSTDVEMNLDSSELSSEQITAFLREVCSQICSKPDTRLGLQQLYEFRSAHPYALEQINQFLAGLGDFFHKYISRSLERIEVENIQASSLKRSALNSSESGNTVEAYKLKLVQLRQQIFGTVEYSENSSNVISENQPPNSPSALSALRRANSHMDSPKMRSIRSNESGSPTKLSAAMDLATATVPPGSPSLAPASPSSILSLKERLARLRGESQLSQQ